MLRESSQCFCELWIYGQALEAAWGTVPLRPKARIPVLDIAQVAAVGGANAAQASREIHLTFQAFHPAGATGPASTERRSGGGLFSRLFSSSSASAAASRSPSPAAGAAAMRRSTGHISSSGGGGGGAVPPLTADSLAAAAAAAAASHRTPSPSPSLPPTVPRRTQSLRLSSSQQPPQQPQQQWETGSVHSSQSNGSSVESSGEARPGYYGDVVRDIFLQTETAEQRLLWVIALTKAVQAAREQEAQCQQLDDEAWHRYEQELQRHLQLQQQQQQLQQQVQRQQQLQPPPQHQ